MHRLVDDVCQQKRLAFGARQAFDQDETDLFWRLVQQDAAAALSREGAEPADARGRGHGRRRRNRCPTFLVRMQNVLKRQQITASLLCHAGQGQLHIQPFLDLDDPGRRASGCGSLAEELYQEVFDAGGTISGGHAYGLSRTPFLARQVGPLVRGASREVKRIFDPGQHSSTRARSSATIRSC